MSLEDHAASHAVRSYVRRPGRITVAQRRALREYWARFGVDDGEGLLDLDRIFGRPAPRVLEIGFGMGDAIVELARLHPERDYLGIDVYEPGIGSLLARLHALDISNVRVVRGDAVDLLQRRVPVSSLDAVMIFFPDPWPKKRHHKRRLVQPGFMSLVCARLRVGGCLELATDWEDYARQMLAVAGGQSELRNLAGAGCFAKRPLTRPTTKFERRGRRLGHGVYDLLLERVAAGTGVG
jgi:tRNA (guanine-N7-)-methyltransferase